ncbi:hypothetical protein [Tropicimonas sp. S265A]|uniref:hypothetical protein n=1 Tax=Tropicimonas sp. S265A TaxID=3415134 RepID=UPI003C7E8350
MSSSKTETTKERLKSAAKSVGASAKAHAKQRVDEAQSTFADRTEAEADSMRRAAAEFDHNPIAQQAAYHLSENLAKAAEMVRHADLPTLQEDVTDFAYKHPFVFFGGAAALGFVAARALKASDRAEGPEMSASDTSVRPQADGVKWGYS